MTNIYIMCISIIHTIHYPYYSEILFGNIENGVYQISKNQEMF